MTSWIHSIKQQSKLEHLPKNLLLFQIQDHPIYGFIQISVGASHAGEILHIIAAKALLTKPTEQNSKSNMVQVV